jgi:2'-hydroxyisoflavone reductase
MRFARRNVLKLSVLALSSLAINRRYPWATTSTDRRAKPLNILILGGTGFIGPHQVHYALARGHQVTLFNRGKQSRDWPGKVEELVGDRNTGALEALKDREWDVCIDNPTTLPFWVRDVGQVLSGKVQQYIFISTISVYAENDKPADESAPVATYSGKDAMAETQDTVRASGGALYGPLKALSEQEAEKHFPGKTTIIRPGLIAGPGDETDRFSYWPVRLARGGEILAPGDGRDPVQFIDVRDLAEWTIRVAESHTIGTFNATGPARLLNIRDMLNGIAMAIRSKCRFTWASADFLESEGVSPWSDMPVWVPGQGDSAGFARRSIQKAMAAGLVFRPLAKTAADTLGWFKQQPADRQATLKAGLSPAREARVLADWNTRSKAHA